MNQNPYLDQPSRWLYFRENPHSPPAFMWYFDLTKEKKELRKRIKLGQKLRHFRWKFKHKHNIKTNRISKLQRRFVYSTGNIYNPSHKKSLLAYDAKLDKA